MKIWQRLISAFPLTRKSTLSKCQADMAEIEQHHRLWVDRCAKKIEEMEMKVIREREASWQQALHSFSETIRELNLTPEQFLEVHAKVEGTRDGTQWGARAIVDQHMVFMLRMSDQDRFPQLIASHLADAIARKLVTWTLQEWQVALEEQRKTREHITRRAGILRGLGTGELSK